MVTAAAFIHNREKFKESQHSWAGESTKGGRDVKGVLLSLKKGRHSDIHHNTDILEDIMLTEIIQSEKDKHCMIPLLKSARAVTLRETQRRTAAARGCREGRKGNCLVSRVSVWNNEKVLEMDSGGGGITM